MPSRQEEDVLQEHGQEKPALPGFLLPVRAKAASGRASDEPASSSSGFPGRWLARRGTGVMNPAVPHSTKGLWKRRSRLSYNPTRFFTNGRLRARLNLAQKSGDPGLEERQEGREGASEGPAQMMVSRWGQSQPASRGRGQGTAGVGAGVAGADSQGGMLGKARSEGSEGVGAPSTEHPLCSRGKLIPGGGRGTGER